MRTRPVGDHALLVLVDDAPTAAATRRLVLELASRHLPLPLDVVPAARTVLLDGLPAWAVAGWASRLANEPPPAVGHERDGARVVTIETVYDGADLEAVALAWSCNPRAVVERHVRAVFVVAFCGFAPGFAYCMPTEPLPQVARLSEPRLRVPAGSVALAGEYCGVYPRIMPGGWRLIGRTRAVLFDPARPEPALLAPGDTVRFRRVR